MKRVRTDGDGNPLPCGFPHCPKPRYGDGLCRDHWWMQRQGKDLVPARTRRPRTGPCAFDGCEIDQEAKGLCSGHYQQRRAGKPLRPLRVRVSTKDLVCEFEGCDNRAKMTGLCVSHDRQRERGLALKPLRARGSTECLHPGCTKLGWPAEGLCEQHWARRRRYGLSVQRYLELVSTTACDICEETTDTLHIDHDHSCCPGAESCGECIRGALCQNCNIMLGMAQNDVERLRKAQVYLTAWTYSAHR